MDRIEFAEQVEGICKRPAAYTINGTFGEVIALIDGFGKGLGVETSHSSLTPFGQWLGRKYNNRIGFLSVKEFRSRYSDDEAAIKAFAILYREFANQEEPLE